MGQRPMLVKQKNIPYKLAKGEFVGKGFCSLGLMALP